MVERHAEAPGFVDQLWHGLGHARAEAPARADGPHPGAKRAEVGVGAELVEQFVAADTVEQVVALLAGQGGEAGRQADIQRALAQQAGAIRVNGADGRGGQAGHREDAALGGLEIVGGLRHAARLQEPVGDAVAQLRRRVVGERHQ